MSAQFGTRSPRDLFLNLHPHECRYCTVFPHHPRPRFLAEVQFDKAICSTSISTPPLPPANSWQPVPAPLGTHGEEILKLFYQIEDVKLKDVTGGEETTEVIGDVMDKEKQIRWLGAPLSRSPRSVVSSVDRSSAWTRSVVDISVDDGCIVKCCAEPARSEEALKTFTGGLRPATRRDCECQRL